MQPTDEANSRAKELANSLNVTTARRVLDELPTMKADGADEKMDPIRRALIERLNGLRPHRARRLFTSLIEPFLHNDLALVKNDAPIAFLFHRAEAAGLWSVLARHAFLEIAVEVAQTMDALCESMVLDDALLTPTALSRRERLRLAALGYLRRLLEDKAGLEHFLVLVTAIRDRELSKLMGPNERVPPFGRNRLNDYMTLLTAAPVLLEHIGPGLELFSDNDNAEAGGKSLVARENALRNSLTELDLPPEAAVALPMLVLRQSRTFGVIGAYLRRRGLSNTIPVAEGLLTQCRGICRNLSTEFSRLLGPKVGLTSPMTAEPEDLGVFEDDIERLGRITQCIRAAEIPNDKRLYVILSGAIGDFLRALGGGKGKDDDSTPLGRLLNRISAAAEASGEVSDFDVILQTLRLLTQIHTYLGRLGLHLAELGTFRELVLREVTFALHRATRIDEEDGPEELSEKFDRIARIEALAQGTGRSLIASLSPTSRHTQQILQHRLEDATPIDERADRILGGYLAAVRSELAAIRYWRNPDLVALSEAGARRNI